MSHTLIDGYIYTGKVGENLITTQLTSSSLILKSTSYLEDEFQPHVGRTKRIFLLLGFLLLGFRRSFKTALTFVEQTWVDSSTCWRVVVTHAGLADQGDFAG